MNDVSENNRHPHTNSWKFVEWGKSERIDATLVLSGAVLTSYVGLTGLVRRMSLDRCLAAISASGENSWRNTNDWI